jgi:hypothetical protein
MQTMRSNGCRKETFDALYTVKSLLVVGHARLVFVVVWQSCHCALCSCQWCAINLSTMLPSQFISARKLPARPAAIGYRQARSVTVTQTAACPLPAGLENYAVKLTSSHKALRPDIASEQVTRTPHEIKG